MVKELHIVIPSSTEFVGPIMSFLYALFKNKNIEEPVVSNVVTSVIEAVANAITHGNNTDIHKKIEIIIYVHEKSLRIEVQDEGQGFSVESLPDPLAPENLLKPCGRGIFLIRSFMDSVEFGFQSNGTRLVMKKEFDRRIE
jgi:serine/threonine-protein kinase RsbW